MPTLALPPMPAGPAPPSILGSVKYLVPLARAMVARKRAQRSIRQLLHDDQHLLDQVLKDLGRAAREHDLDVPAIADEMRRVKAEEQRRAKAEADIAKADDEMRPRGRALERRRGRAQERDHARREGELKETEDELRAKGEERRGHEAERARLDALIRAAEKRSAQAMQQAQKAEITPPEKGGGPNTAANLRLQSEDARKEATSLIAPRDEAKAQVEALDAPIHTLTQQHRRHARDAGAEAQGAGRCAARSTRRRWPRSRPTSSGAARERSDAEREMSQRFVNVGTMLNLHRVEDSHYRALYARHRRAERRAQLPRSHHRAPGDASCAPTTGAPCRPASSSSAVLCSWWCCCGHPPGRAAVALMRVCPAACALGRSAAATTTPPSAAGDLSATLCRLPTGRVCGYDSLGGCPADDPCNWCDCSEPGRPGLGAAPLVALPVDGRPARGQVAARCDASRLALHGRQVCVFDPGCARPETHDRRACSRCEERREVRS